MSGGDALEEIIGDRSPIAADGSASPTIRAALERVRGTGLAMLRGWHKETRSSTATIRVQPQRAVQVRRLIIPSADAGNWRIHDIRVPASRPVAPRVVAGGTITGTEDASVSFLVEPVPGDVFSQQQSDVALDLPALAPLQSIELVVEYVGGDPEGAVFNGVFMCGAPAEADGSRKMVMIPLPVNSGGRRIKREPNGVAAWIRLDDDVYRFEARERIDRIMSMLRMPDAQLPGDATYELGAVVERMVSLHLLELPFGVDGDMSEVVLFGIDDATSRIVFELGNLLAVVDPARDYFIGTGIADGDGKPLALRFHAKCDLDGYVPTWWDRAQRLYEDLRDPRDPDARYSLGSPAPVSERRLP